MMDQLDSIDSIYKPKKMTNKVKSNYNITSVTAKDPAPCISERPRRVIKKPSTFDNSDCLLNSNPTTNVGSQ